MAKKTIAWECDATRAKGWQWLSAATTPPGSPNPPGFPVEDDPKQTGTIDLLPNPGYWYSCVDLVLQGVTTGNAIFRYFEGKDQDCVQAYVVAQNLWVASGSEDSSTSIATGRDFDLIVKIVES